MIALLGAASTAAALAQDAGVSGRISMADAKKLKNPVPYTKKSIAAGRIAFIRHCTSCHGNDGKATIDVVANATDLTSPNLYKNGTSEGEIFRSIRDGAGDGMPPFLTEFSSQQDMWHLVNFIRSLWPEANRPPLQDDK